MEEKTTILFVDDEPNVLGSLRRMLRDKEKEWNMWFAGSAGEAKTIMAEHNCDVVLLDVNMPGESGLDFLAEIKGSAATKGVEVIVFTGMDDHHLKTEALNRNATDLLVKPVYREDLIARINSALRSKYYQDALCAQNHLLEQQLIQSQKIELVGILAAGVVHDLRNTIGLVRVWSDMLLEDNTLEQTQKDALGKMFQASNLALQIVEQIHGLSKPSQSEFERLNMVAIVDSSLGLLQAIVPKKVQVVWERPDRDCWIIGDGTELYQVLLNLCLNCVQAMKDRGVLRIAVRTESAGGKDAAFTQDKPPVDYVVLEVSDTGEGMNEEMQHRIFDPLFTTKSNSGGTGLGLSVVRRIIDNHGGRIVVRSAEGKGTVFCVYMAELAADNG